MNAATPLRHFLILLAALAAGAVMVVRDPAPAHAQARQTVRAFAKPDGGTVIIEWRRPVKVNMGTAGTRVVLIFARPLAASLAAIERGLPRIVARIDISPDRRAVTLELRSPHKVRAVTRGRFVILEFLRPGAKRKAERKPKKPEPRAKGSDEPVPVAYKRRPTYERLTFGWDRKVGYTVARAVGTIVLTFERRGRVDMAALRAQLAGSGLAVAVAIRDDKLVVTVRADPNRHHRHYAAGTNVVLEVLKKGAVAESARRPDADKNAGPKPKRLVPKDTTGKKPSGEAMKPKGEDKDKDKHAAPPAPGHAQVSLSKPGGVATLRFDWSGEVPAAVFRRGRFIWLVFGAAARLDLKPVRAGLASEVFSLDQVPTKGATAVRMAAAPETGVFISRDGTAWLIALKPGAGKAGTAVSVQPQPRAAGGGRLWIKTAAAGRAITLVDPDAGDTLFVVPVGDARLGVEPGRRFTKFRLLPTIQGIVVEALADGIRVRVDKTGVSVTGKGGLNLSRRALKREPAGKTRVATGRIFDFDSWRGGPAKNFPRDYIAVRKTRLHAVAVATKGKRNARRMDLARYYFIHAHPSDAVGVLKLVEQDDAALARTAKFRALRGASRFLMGQLKSAGRDLFDPSLDGYFEVALWRGAVAADSGNWRTADTEFKRSRWIIWRYPPHLRIVIGLRVAEAAVEVGDTKRAAGMIALIADKARRAGDKDTIDYLKGRILAARGKHAAAVVVWDRLRTSGRHTRGRVRAAVARTAHLLDAGWFDLAKAAGELERLRFAWRGDGTEFAVNELLGRVYLKAGRYEEALVALKRTRRIDAVLARSRKITQRMQRIFANLFVGGRANKLPPVRALGLFHQHADLIPAGPGGDRMIAALADRLVAVDLLDRAGALLTQQIEKRLTGTARARVGARLALVRLLDRKPKAAIAALRLSDVEKMPADLAKQRRRLRARALASLGQSDNALVLIGPDEGREANLLRADIHWKRENWKAAAKAYGRIAKGFPKDASTLDDTQARTVVLWAVTLALAGDAEALRALKARFGAAMDSGPYRSTFRVIATEIEGGVPNYRKIIARVSEVEHYQAFMGVYRKRLAKGGLQAVN